MFVTRICSFQSLLRLGVYLLLWLLLHPAASTTNVTVDCDPCIRRDQYLLKAIVHGTQDDAFWKVVISAMHQAARDTGLALEVELLEEYSPPQMAQEIRRAASSGDYHALIVTLPSAEVHEAVRFATQEVGLPVFGLNSGYEAAQELGLLGFVAQNEYLAGQEAALEFQRQSSSPIRSGLLINHQKGVLALDERFRGFHDGLISRTNGTAVVEELEVSLSDLLALNETLSEAFHGCRYDVVLTTTSALVTVALQVLQQHGCLPSNILTKWRNTTMIATFDEDDPLLNRDIVQGKLAFAISQQRYIQGILPVVMASTYVTTKKRLALPLEHSGIYLSGPLIVNRDNLPTDTQILCEAQGFPICGNDEAPKTLCPCFDRSALRIAGVLHGVTTDAFWDPVFGVARQTARDLGIQLDLDRLQPQTNDTVLYEKMAVRIEAECRSGVHGIFLTIPSSKAVQRAVRLCQLLKVPVMAINSAPKLSQQLGIVGHIGQDEYSAGYQAGLRLVEAGMTEGYCLNHAPGTSGIELRCQGFGDAITEQQSAVQYRGMVIVPQDMDEEFRIRVEEAVGRQGEWEGVGFLIAGIVQLAPALQVQEDHSQLLLGSFDVSEAMYPPLEANKLLFTFDQQPYLQGAWPVHLLAYNAYTNQRLLNFIVQTGPNALLAPPSPSEQICEANLYRVCSTVPAENYNYINPSWLAVGYAFVALIVVTAAVCLVWMFQHRRSKVVAAAQPPFLVLLVVGCVVHGLAIIPLGIETGYRNPHDHTHYLNEDQNNPSVANVDATCMLAPWLFGIGFTLMFSALLAKIFRVTLIYHAGRRMLRKRVGHRHVAWILLATLSIELALLLSWQLVSPLRWTREVVLVGPEGHSLESAGRCASDHGLKFLAGVVGFHILCLLCALVLCWQAKHIPTDFAESNWVSLSVVFVFQVSLLTGPITAMVQEDTDVLYFVRACALFLQSFTVLLFLFAPKMYRVYQGDDTGPKEPKVYAQYQDNSASNAGDLVLSTCCHAEVTTVCTCCGCYVNSISGDLRRNESVMLIEVKGGVARRPLATLKEEDEPEDFDNEASDKTSRMTEQESLTTDSTTRVDKVD